ncbi:unnamed protein product [Alopecurus aequalis]
MSAPPPPQGNPGSTLVLVDDAMREIFLRLPSDDPKSLVCAAAVCTSWRGILSNDAFARQYREFHGAPPMLGFLRSKCYRKRKHIRRPRPNERDEDFVIYDLVTYDRWRIKASVECSDIIWHDQEDEDENVDVDVGITWNAAVLCAKERCDHLYCHGGAFLVVLVGCHDQRGITFAAVYSSETCKWSDMISIENAVGIEMCGCSALVGNKEGEVLPYAILEGVEDGMLLFANVVKTTLHLWSLEAAAGSNGALAVARYRVIQLEPLLPACALVGVLLVIGFAEGVGVIFLSTEAGLYTIELISGRSKKVHVDISLGQVVPYMSFYTRGTS